MNEDEKEWILAAQAGDTHAFGQLVERYQERMMAVVGRIVRDHDLARDACQQAWIKAWKKLKSFKGDSAFYTWMYRIATHASLDLLRRNKRRGEVAYLEEWEAPRAPEGERPHLERPDQELHRQEFRDAFDAALGELSPLHRSTLVLREIEGLSYQEIAEIMGCRTGTVMSRLFHARQHMQQMLEKWK